MLKEIFHVDIFCETNSFMKMLGILAGIARNIKTNSQYFKIKYISNRNVNNILLKIEIFNL